VYQHNLILCDSHCRWQAAHLLLSLLHAVVDGPAGFKRGNTGRLQNLWLSRAEECAEVAKILNSVECTQSLFVRAGDKHCLKSVLRLCTYCAVITNDRHGQHWMHAGAARVQYSTQEGRARSKA
jgi:hypothetical protein